MKTTKALCSSKAIMLLFAVCVSLTTLQVFQRYIVCRQDDLLNRSISFRGKGLNVCRHPSFAPKANKRLHQQILYQCAGPDYDIFSRRMLSFADNQVLHGPTWGRRDYPLAGNSTVLMLGNSHTRQVGVEMACQYSSVLRSMWRNEPSDLTIFEFDNNSSMFLLTNTPLVYSYQWKNLLEVTLGKKLQEFDAVVLGVFNQFSGQATTNFDKGMIERSKNLPTVDYLNIFAPSPWQILAEFDGYMAILSMFSKWDQKWIDIEKAASFHSNRVIAINSRKYVPILGECGSDTRLGTGECFNDDIKRDGMRRPNGMHRCVGAHGGHPDLIAWEVTEFLYTLKDRPLPKPKEISSPSLDVATKSSFRPKTDTNITRATLNKQPLPKPATTSSQSSSGGATDSNVRPANDSYSTKATWNKQPLPKPATTPSQSSSGGAANSNVRPATDTYSTQATLNTQPLPKQKTTSSQSWNGGANSNYRTDSTKATLKDQPLPKPAAVSSQSSDGGTTNFSIRPTANSVQATMKDPPLPKVNTVSSQSSNGGATKSNSPPSTKANGTL